MTSQDPKVAHGSKTRFKTSLLIKSQTLFLEGTEFNVSSDFSSSAETLQTTKPTYYLKGELVTVSFIISLCDCGNRVSRSDSHSLTVCENTSDSRCADSVRLQTAEERRFYLFQRPDTNGLCLFRHCGVRTTLSFNLQNEVLTLSITQQL